MVEMKTCESPLLPCELVEGAVRAMSKCYHEVRSDRCDFSPNSQRSRIVTIHIQKGISTESLDILERNPCTGD